MKGVKPMSERVEDEVVQPEGTTTEQAEIVGQNGHGETNTPGTLSSAVAIAAGNGHSLAVLSDGTVVSPLLARARGYRSRACAWVVGYVKMSASSENAVISTAPITSKARWKPQRTQCSWPGGTGLGLSGQSEGS